jgi:serine phosphatase RsbU (regulator of sigma subunit)
MTYASAGGCPPFLLDGGGSHGTFLAVDAGAPLGAAAQASRRDSALVLTPGSTLLLFTEGLVQSATVPWASGLERLREVVVGGPVDLDDLCDRVLTVCADKVRRDDDICLLAVRVPVATVSRRA